MFILLRKLVLIEQMEYSPAQKYINLPQSAYRWVLLDSVEHFENELFAVYEHNDEKLWCVLKKSDLMNSIDVFMFTENKEIPDYIETDMECLINLISNSIINSTFVIKSKKNGNVSDAYKLNISR